MKILHTSDWHIGHTLYGRQRQDEFEALLIWLVELLRQEAVDLLLIAGDIFDSPAPSTKAQSFYYRLLAEASKQCRHVLIIGGNHDSPALLDAPAALLQPLNLHIIGGKRELPEQEVRLLSAPDGTPELLVAAVPYLRERDLRIPSPGESPEEKEQQLLEGLRQHYQNVIAQAEQLRRQLPLRLPLLVTGHLFASGCPQSSDDGMRDLYVGSLGQFPLSLLPEGIDYLALGHLHRPQMVNGNPHLRYSGSPLPMGFAESHLAKSVTLVTLEPDNCVVQLLPVPRFQELLSLRGSWPEIEAALLKLLHTGSQAWLEIIHTGTERIGNLRERIEQLTATATLQVLRIKEQRLLEQAHQQEYTDEPLQDLDPQEVFSLCMQQLGVQADQQTLLLAGYQEILHQLFIDPTHEKG
ncbi:exonuclease SbcCD subunit D C-terminal domain-containing protein [Candidatus Magnetaquicoccus inordinatus]|uniref:exonuclease SbcCD subunit D C-terminal domain-containing protein n=1 Tax=Candidatus Magnetaquicoccus inordinatus TaxID=2496818 RepID=UPI00102C4041|nr:exonuclease SbcCD subunit D C-terminal domain-containing protein [Candidatus Magnetaquicoccus inordinatus]